MRVRARGLEHLWQPPPPVLHTVSCRAFLQQAGLFVPLTEHQSSVLHISDSDASLAVWPTTATSTFRTPPNRATSKSRTTESPQERGSRKRRGRVKSCFQTRVFHGITHPPSRLLLSSSSIPTTLAIDNLSQDDIIWPRQLAMLVASAT